MSKRLNAGAASAAHCGARGWLNLARRGRLRLAPLPFGFGELSPGRLNAARATRERAAALSRALTRWHRPHVLAGAV